MPNVDLPALGMPISTMLFRSCSMMTPLASIRRLPCRRLPGRPTRRPVSGDTTGPPGVSRAKAGASSPALRFSGNVSLTTIATKMRAKPPTGEAYLFPIQQHAEQHAEHALQAQEQRGLRGRHVRQGHVLDDEGHARREHHEVGHVHPEGRREGLGRGEASRSRRRTPRRTHRPPRTAAT